MATATRTTRQGRRSAAPDAVAAAAVDLARAAAEEIAEPGAVGEHLGVRAEGERLVSHMFDCTAKGYRGWRWTVTLARAPRARVATVCEAELLPGDDALLAPPWVPWADRLRPGDLGATDVLPRVADDVRLEPGFTATGDEDVDQVGFHELGLGRPRVLSREGRHEAATRWHDGDFGPGSPTAKAAAAPCRTCGFYLSLAGALRQEFGICANEWSPADGHVVANDFGCGAHSETDIERRAEPLPPPVLDEVGYDPLVR